jgi:ADP-heptose:LPS heptosyltransferase/glycosyltransferase involved in cell wall biosynthesis
VTESSAQTNLLEGLLAPVPTLSVVVITHNEDHNIAACLESVFAWADDLVVVDSHSTDRTAAIAESLGARVFQRKWAGYSATKNWANEQAKGDWILSLDADEVVSETLQHSILEFLKTAGDNAAGSAGATRAISMGAEMNRLTQYCGVWVWHSGWYPDRKVRLWKKNTAMWRGELHETLVFDDPRHANLTRLHGNILHFSYPSAETHYAQIEKFGRIWALGKFRKGKQVGRAMGALKVGAQWAKTYLVKGGFRDGSTGWVIARRSAFATARKLQILRALWRAKAMKRFIICRTDAIGDVVLSLPIAAAIKADRPDAHVAFCVRAYAAAVVACSPFVDEILIWDPGQENFSQEPGAFDAGVLAFPDSAVLKALRAIKVGRIAGTGRRLHTVARLNDPVWSGRKFSGLHEAEHGLKLLERWGIPPLEGDQLDAATRLNAPPPSATVELLLDGKTPVLIHPGSAGSAGNWPVEKFAELGRTLVEHGHRVLVTGTEDEGVEFRDAFPWSTGLVDTTGQLRLEELIALIGQSELLVASSTGPLHIAAGIGIRCLGLYQAQAPMWPARWAPIGPKASWIAADSLDANGHLDLSVQEVTEALGAFNRPASR